VATGGTKAFGLLAPDGIIGGFASIGDAILLAAADETPP